MMVMVVVLVLVLGLKPSLVRLYKNVKLTKNVMYSLDLLCSLISASPGLFLDFHLPKLSNSLHS